MISVIQVSIFLVLGFFAFSNRSTVPRGHYYGSAMFYRLYVEVKSDTTFVDCIVHDRYPRGLHTDTLSFNEKDQMWSGRMFKLYPKNGKYYVDVIDPSSNFFTRKGVKIKPNEAHYKKTINEYKNLAVLYECYKDYLKEFEDKQPGMKRFHEIRERHNLDQHKKHAEFLKDLEVLKADLNTSK